MEEPQFEGFPPSEAEREENDRRMRLRMKQANLQHYLKNNSKEMDKLALEAERLEREQHSILFSVKQGEVLSTQDWKLQEIEQRLDQIEEEVDGLRMNRDRARNELKDTEEELEDLKK